MLFIFASTLVTSGDAMLLNVASTLATRSNAMLWNFASTFVTGTNVAYATNLCLWEIPEPIGGF
jgi:adenine-specific DNA methylase